VKTLALLLLLAGCQKILGFHDTKLEPDATVDAPPDSPPDAPPPPVDVGSGGDGDLMVTGTTMTDSVATALTAAVGANSTLLHVADVTGFDAGDEVVIFQMTGTTAGVHETNRVASTAPSQILLASQLRESYGADGAVQIIRVPNYHNVTVLSGGVLTARAWDSTLGVGGVVFFRATGTVDVQTGGALTAEALGFAGGSGGQPGTGGTGGTGGLGGGHVACPAGGLGCNVAAAAGPPGGPGQLGGGGLPGHPGHAAGNNCSTGAGGAGALFGADDAMMFAGNPGAGVVAADLGTGGTNPSALATTPILGGGGGGGGNSGLGGRGAGGGGGGGGPISDKNGTINPVDGAKGGDGGAGGAGGAGGDGGRGGGIIIVFANAFSLEGTLSANGASGVKGVDGGSGGNGGNGGAGGTPAQNCGGLYLAGEQGAPGNGGSGGAGGNGGGGGAGGVIEIAAFSVTAGGNALAMGGALGDIGRGGGTGSGGTGYGGPAPDGPASTDGTAGTAGGSGQLFLDYVTACAQCNAFGMPTAIVTQL
jgi:hypothetical protein